jgi:hypothetical protein
VGGWIAIWGTGTGTCKLALTGAWSLASGGAMASVCVEVLAYLWMEAGIFALSGHVAPSIGVSGGLMGDTEAFAATETGWRMGSCWR